MYTDKTKLLMLKKGLRLLEQANKLLTDVGQRLEQRKKEEDEAAKKQQ